MTEVLSAIFGRKKPKGPAPSPPVTNNNNSGGTDATSDGFVFVPSPSVSATNPANSLYPNPRDSQSGDYESLFSFLKVESVEANNGMYRPARPAPPVPANGMSPLTYGLRPSNESNRTIEGESSESQSSGFYVSGVPFQISKSLGGGVSVVQMQSELSEVMNRVKAPNLSSYEYSFGLEEQVLREINS